MKKLILLLLISGSAWAQEGTSKKHNYEDFSLIVKVEDQEKYYNELLQESPEDKSKPAQYDAYRASLAIGWLAKGNLDRYKFYTNNDPKISYLNLLNLTYTLEYLVEDDKNLRIVEEVSKQILDKLDKAKVKDDLSLDRMQVLLEVNAMANAKLGNVDIAMKNIERSSTIKGMREGKYFRDSKSNYLNRYSIVLSAAGQHKRALDTLTKAVRNADSNPRLIATLREVYKKVNGNDKGADEYIKSLQDEAYQKYYKEVEGSYIADITAPVSGAVKNFNGEMLTVFNGKQLAKNVSLPDLNGKMVNFVDLEGKILVIDFWTTACTPCVAAFAGFERVVSEYKKEPFQLFVINLFEPVENVKSFIAKKGITLDVLHDEPNKAFDIQATPTKIIFDPMGNIRFYGIGYAGSTDREYYKLKAMIEIIKTRASDDVAAQQKPEANPKLQALQNEKDQTVLQQKIKALEEGTAEDLDLLIQYYDKDAANRNAIIKKLLKKYPQSQYAGMQRLKAFLNLSGGAPEMETLLQSMIRDYPNVNLDFEKSLVSSAYAEIPNTTKALGFINAIEDPIFKVRALSMTIDIIAAFDNKTALEIATKELEQVKKLKGQTAVSKPLKLDPKAAYDDYINTYGKLLFKADKNTEAYQYTAEAYNNIKDKDDELIENYAFLSSLNGKYEEALPVLANAVKEGKNEKRYIEQVRKGYAKLNPGKDVDAYIALLQKDFIDKIKTQVSKLMINEPAPDFTVTDVNGKIVSLADFKGKTIVLDFWATWCGPCVASFPAMQMAADRYAADPNVKFLFIHTWENVANPLADATSFLNKRDYKFDLYMDPRSPTTKRSAAADAFKVSGIPAKFIIDGNGKVRFKVSGFEGKNEAAAEEVVQMVEIARKGV